ncbi:hypothetical protein LZ32DRAFT_666536 [Colletotrichum eremochloae]|nr:hypothetical protein LZ32DRAFT_666536 [Colletotrichum eremochloae]
MADPLITASSVLAVITTTIASTRVLSETLSCFENHDRTLQRLQCELNDLSMVLNSLKDMPQPDLSLIILLKEPISWCS